MFDSIKSIIAYTLSLDVISLAVMGWLSSFGNTVSNVASIIVGIATFVITILSGLHIYSKWQGQKLANKKARLEIEALEKQGSKIIKQ